MCPYLETECLQTKSIKMRLSWIRVCPNPMTDVLKKREIWVKHGHTGRHHVTVEAEIGVMRL